MEQQNIEDIKAINIFYNDVIIIKVTKECDTEGAKIIYDTFKDIFPNNEIIIVPSTYVDSI